MAMNMAFLTIYYQLMLALFTLLKSTIISSCEIRIIEKIIKEIYTVFKFKKGYDGYYNNMGILLYCSE